MSNTPSETEIDNLLCKHWPAYSIQAVLVKMWLREAIESAIAQWGTPQPVVRAAMTPIRQAAFDLYTPPFRQEYGYIRDANNQMVADDAGSEGAGTIAARIRGWGRIQYMDKPELRAEALQDEVGNIVIEALNDYWASHGITQNGGSNVK